MHKYINILDQQFLGSGAHWEVHALNLAPPGYEVGGNHYLRVAQKLGGPLDSNIEHYLQCKSAGIPTLEFFEAAYVDGKRCILCEDLSIRERLYVSPNTARQLPSIRDMLIAHLLKEKGMLQASLQEDNKSSSSETRLVKKKVKKVTNLEELVQEMAREAFKASKAGMALCEDVFFFGTNRSTETALDFMVADFDTICLFGEDDSTDCLALVNEKVGLTAIWEFFEYFVEPGTHRSECQERLQSILAGCITRLELLDEA